MVEKEKLKEKLRNEYNKLKTEIRKIKDEDFQNFDQDFEQIIGLIDEEKMELSEISPLNEKDQERFVNYYSNKNIGKTQTFIKKRLKEANYDLQKTFEVFKEYNINIDT